MHDAPSRAWSIAAKQCAALIAIAFVIRCIGLQFGLPHALARPDEETIISHALRLETIAGWDPNFFSYPSLLIYTAYGCFKALLWGLRLFGATDADTLRALFLENPGLFHLTLRIISALCGSFTVAAVYAAARQLFGRGTALLAGLVLGLCYLHVRDSHFGVTDVPCVLFASLSFWQLTKLYRRGRLRHLGWAAVFAGLAIGTKYTAAWLCWPFLIAIIAAAKRHHRTEPAVWATLAAILAVAATLAAFAATTPYFFLHPGEAWDDFTWEMLLLSEEVPVQPGLGGHVFYLRVALAYGLGWPVLAVALAGGVWMALRRDGRALLLWSLPVLYFLFTGRSNRIFIRYMDPVLPFLAIACGWAVRSAFVTLRYTHPSFRVFHGRDPYRSVPLLSEQCEGTQRNRVPLLCEQCEGKDRPGQVRLSRVLPVFITLALLTPGIVRIVKFDRLLRQMDTRLELRTWMLAHVPPNEPVLWSGGWSALPYLLPHQPIRSCDATELLQPVLLRDPSVLYRYRWIVLIEWPRAYYLHGRNATERAFLAALMKGRYELAYEIDAYKAHLPPELFCTFDHFYLSFQRPDIIQRPGPGFRIYRRTEAPPPLGLKKPA